MVKPLDTNQSLPPSKSNKLQDNPALDKYAEQVVEKNKLQAGEDRVSLETSQTEKTYGPAGVGVASPYQLLRALVVKTLQDQGVSLQVDTGQEMLDLTTLTPEAAQELIADDGYFGVEKTSQRIVDFALNGFGHDPSKLNQMKDAIEKGFQEAAAVFGGDLPEISHQTYEAIMEKLDAFAAQFDESVK